MDTLGRYDNDKKSPSAETSAAFEWQFSFAFNIPTFSRKLQHIVEVAIFSFETFIKSKRIFLH